MQTMFSLLKTIVLRGHMTSTESNGEQFMRPLWSLKSKVPKDTNWVLILAATLILKPWNTV